MWGLALTTASNLAEGVFTREMMDNSTFTFSSKPLMDMSDAILEGMKWAKQDMQEKGLLTDETTFEDISLYAGRHVRITECKTK